MDALEFKRKVYQAIISESDEKILYHSVCDNSIYVTHGFVMNTKDFNISFAKFFVVCYGVINEQEKLFILSNYFDDYNESIKKMEYYLAYFPVYCNSIRYDI